MSPGITFDPLSSSFFDERIRETEGRLVALQEAVAKATAELHYWKKGRALFVEATDVTADVTDEDRDWRAARMGVDPDSEIIELTPSSVVLYSPGTKPTLRQAVLQVFLDQTRANGHEPEWEVADVMQELDRRDWLPESPKYARNRVKHMLLDLEKQGVLEHPAYGVYALAAQVRATPTADLRKLARRRALSRMD